MQNDILRLVVFFTTALVLSHPHGAWASSSQFERQAPSSSRLWSVDLSYGWPISSQNVEIDTYDVVARYAALPMSDNFYLGASGRLGAFNGEDKTAVRAGAGAFLEKRWQYFSVSIPFGVVWLSEHEFVKDERHKKDYGGPIQFTYGLRLAWQVSERWQVFYAIEHMSNADRYDKNPALDTHHLGVSFSF